MDYADRHFLNWLARVSVQERLNLDALAIAFREPQQVVVRTDDLQQAQRLWTAAIKTPPRVKVQIFLNRELYVEC